MAEQRARRPGPWTRASVRTRTTVVAVLVVAVALLAGAFTLVALVQDSLDDGVRASADQRATALVDEIESPGLPEQPRLDPTDLKDGPEDEVWQIRDAAGTVVRTSELVAEPIPPVTADEIALPGSDHGYRVVTRHAGRYDVTVASSLRVVEDTTSALLLPLLVGVPLILLLVGVITWSVATRALAPVDRIRQEVDQITGDRLERRVPEPPTRDEVHRLATTMNRMLSRLEGSRDRQRQFVADASHELRSPLASLRQAAEVAQAHPGALPEGDLADTVVEEAQRMQRLVEQLLLLTRADEGGVALKPRDVDLDDLALAEANRLRRGGLSVDVTGLRNGRVRGEEAALAQVVRNLADNAARHARSVVRISMQDVGAEVELVVEDDGPGVPEEQRTRVFERFVRLDEARARDDGGSGLGLAIVAEIARAHGGSVTVSSTPLGGAAFAVRLPREP